MICQILMPEPNVDDPGERKAWAVFIWYLFAIAAMIAIGSVLNAVPSR